MTPCTCRIQMPGTRYEVRILDRACPRHLDPIPPGPGLTPRHGWPTPHPRSALTP